ncbi:unnamed protein product [Fusarium venenatum]|uniref:Uncharacterized protein n=1 Tax=Fusarium venenatum TaxID=56646 RepID=A0A2L2U1W1_9HYPO|nr:uncharacterized protein FVRRES_08282 [Fusarium venenatum]CEI68205.1 unnamed protein product [Fusarium venenatum]
MSAPYDPNQGVDIPLKATLLLARATLPHSLTSKRHHLKKKRATAASTHVSPHSAVVGSAERPASVVLNASTAAVNQSPTQHCISPSSKRLRIIKNA